MRWGSGGSEVSGSVASHLALTIRFADGLLAHFRAYVVHHLSIFWIQNIALVH